MNKDLQKDIITPSERINKRRGYSKKYMARHQTMCVTLAKDADADIIAWLEDQENKSVAVREIIRKHIANEKIAQLWSKPRIAIGGKVIDEEEC